MQRLRTTFTRSRTPTGAEMKMQSSLEVPKQVRSASFDEMQLEAQRMSQMIRHQSVAGPSGGGDDDRAAILLQVPAASQPPCGQRSRSFDSASTAGSSGSITIAGSSGGSGSAGGGGSDDASTFLEVPWRFNQRRRSSNNASYTASLGASGGSGIGPSGGTSNSNTSAFVASHTGTFGSGSGSVATTTTAAGATAFNSASTSMPYASASKPFPCVHCLYLEEYERRVSADKRYFIDYQEVKALSYSDTSSSDGELDNVDYTSYDEELTSDLQSTKTFGNFLLPPPPCSPCNITLTLSPTSNGDFPVFSSINDADYPPQHQHQQQRNHPLALAIEYPPMGGMDGGVSPTIEVPLHFDEPPMPRTRRRSISRQEAVFVEPTGTSLENVATSEASATDTTAMATDNDDTNTLATSADLVRDIYLQVPDLKRDRAASVDSCFSKVSSGGKTEELQPPDGGLTLTVPNNASLRSRSVDIVLPTDEQARYKALALAGPAPRSGLQLAGVTSDPDNWTEERLMRCTPDWTVNALAGDHLWAPSSVSGDCCYAGDNCTKTGPRMKCSACKIIIHVRCATQVADKSQLACKPTFRDVGVRQYREQTTTHHHWIHRRTEKGKCKQCGKSLQAKLSFSSKDIVALSCAWCKMSYHNKEACFNQQRVEEECSLGAHSSIIVPPSWIVKLPRKGCFKSSLRKSPKKKPAGKKKSKEREPRTFVIKPIPTANVTPVLVFINPKSGGNQGAKLLQKFQWLLNPRQVFDLTQGGPNLGLELFRKVPQLRVLACGGDGTVGWVLSVLDQLGVNPAPAVGVLPLGTGNDLARALGWGGGYTDEPIGKILENIGNSDTVLLDRWSLKLEPNTNAEGTFEDGKDKLPLNVVNNYFSLGVDAHIALEFHEAREAHPEKFNSRLRNKMFYGQAGGKDLLKRKWKGLAEFVTLECDGKDMTPKLKEHKVHAIVFLNIASYGGGTHPWNKSGGQIEPATDDGLIEIVGLTTYQLPLLQAGGHGTCIAQCKAAKIVTSKTIPMQVDGEACKLKPSIIELSLLNKAVMLAKKKPGRANVQQATLDSLTISVHRITMQNYDRHHYDKELLQKSATLLGTIDVSPIADLEQVRNQINRYCEEHAQYPNLSIDWCFVDSCTAERFFRVDRAQEHLHYVTDVANEVIYVLDQECPTMPQTPEDDSTLKSIDNTIVKSIDQQLPPTIIDPLTESHNKGTIDRTPSSPVTGNKFHRSGDSQSKDVVLSSSGCGIGGGNVIVVGTGGGGGGGGGNKHNDIKSNNTGRDDGVDQQRLLENGNSFQAMVNIKSNLLEKTTDTIIKAGKIGDLPLLKELYSHGYSLLSIDLSGQTALHYSSKYGHKDVVRFLIAFAPHAIINMVDNEKGQTALHKAAANKRHAVCYMLVAAGAYLGLEDNDGQTPKTLAEQAGDHQLSAYLDSQELFQTSDYETHV